MDGVEDAGIRKTDVVRPEMVAGVAAQGTQELDSGGR